MEAVLITHDLAEALFIADHLSCEGFDWRFSNHGALANLAFTAALPVFTIIVASDEADEAREEIAALQGRL